MMHPGSDSLAHNFPQLPSQSPEVSGLPDFDDSSLLERFISRLCDRIRDEGLNSLHWVTGIHTAEIRSGLLEVMSQEMQAEPIGEENFCIVVKPGEDHLIEPFKTRFGGAVRGMQEFYADSFVIVNGVSVLDVTPVATDDGKPEFNDDPTVVDLYVGLFNMLKHRSTPGLQTA